VEQVIVAILHDTIEDTDTTEQALVRHFGKDVANIVLEVNDDKTLPKAERKRLQIEHASQLSRRARLVKLADTICNLRDLAASPPANWSVEPKQAYFDWARAVVDGLRGTHPGLEHLFDQSYQARPKRPGGQSSLVFRWPLPARDDVPFVMSPWASILVRRWFVRDSWSQSSAHPGEPTATSTCSMR
jgi:guanosine-3',5'-bis(diphosphate) 3'-pyrophosphohydrolase